MRIAFDYQIFSFQSYGGVSRYFSEMVKQLCSTPGAKPFIVAPIYVNEYLRNLDPDIVIGRYFPKPPYSGPVFRRLNRALAPKQLRNIRPDITHETYYQGRRTDRRAKTPVVTTVHDMVHEKFPQWFATIDPTVKLKKQAIHRADHIICVSENTRRDLVEITGIAAEKTSTVHLGVTSLASNVNSHQRLTPGPYVLFVGDRGGHKNFSTLLDAFANTKSLNSEFQLVCFGGPSFNQRELSRISTLGLTRKQVIHISGGDSKLLQVYAQASAFVYPSLYEGFGLPPLEAMSLGCPVVCSDRGSIPEIVGPAGEYFDPTDPESLSSSLLNVVTDSERTHVLRDLGKAQVRQYSWERCANKTLDVYRQLL